MATTAVVGLAWSTLLVAPAPLAAAENVPNAYREDGKRLAAAVDISPAEGVRRLRLQDEVEGLHSIVNLRWPQTFAGLWIDHPRGGTVTIAFVESAEANVAALAEDFSEPQLLRAATMKYTLDELQARQNQMALDREAARAGRLSFPSISGARYDLRIDVQRNALVVTADRPTGQTVAAFKSRYGDDIVVETGRTLQPACTRADCRHTLRAGLHSDRDGSVAECTTGFAAHRWWNEWAILSAAHCHHSPVPGEWALHGGQAYGYREVEVQQGAVDAEFHRVVYSGFTAQPTIYVNDFEKAREVRAKGLYDNLPIGAFVCKSGRTTGDTCGFVNTKNSAPNYVANSWGFIGANMCTLGGDSGGPVYSSYKARGIVSGSNYDCNNPFMVFGHTEFLEDALNVTVDTTTNTPYLWYARAVAGSSNITAYFSDRISCSSVSATDFSVSVTTGSRVFLADAYQSCSVTGNVVLRLSYSGTPFVLAPGMTLRVDLVGLVESEFGNEVDFPDYVTTAVSAT